MGINKKVLYISYDGMTDPLGQSQVLPYLLGLSKYGYEFTILSFEKKERFNKNRGIIEKIASSGNIKWIPLSFTSKPPLVAKFYDAIRMKRKAFQLHRENDYAMVHCRSYLAADIGLALKKKFGIKFFFDMRGFWADEKRDAGTWKESSVLFRNVYKYYKRKEKEFLTHADYIVSLTESGKKEMQTWPYFQCAVPLGVIPCCADMRHFSLTSPKDKINGRKILGLPVDILVVSYLGSVGAWYMLDEMLELFSYILKKYPGAKFLFVTHSQPEIIISRLGKFNISPEDIIITEANREQVPIYIKASDVNISFIQPVYSKISSSPTKLGEVLSMGIPVISNAGVGDVKATLLSVGGGVVLENFSKDEYIRAVNSIPSLLDHSAASIREKAENIYSLDKGISLYLEYYQSLFHQNDNKN